MRSRTPPSINAGSMADIAFLLLIFFLVSTNIKNPMGIQVILPKYVDDVPPTPMNEDEVLTVKLNKENRMNVIGHITSKIGEGKQPIISLVTDTSAVYGAYLQVYDQIKSAYSQLREEYAQETYNRPYAALERPMKKKVNERIPMIISEADYF